MESVSYNVGLSAEGINSMAFFITLEGVEGCGKTTQTALLADWLRKRGHQITITREPGGCPISDRIRAILLDPANSAITPDTELFLYAAARSQHVAEVIKPALESGISVICDRFTDATLAYQGYARGLDLDKIRHLNLLAAGAVNPDLTLLLDYPPDAGLKRARQRNQAHATDNEGRFESEAIAFHQRVRDGYLELAVSDRRIQVLDAQGEIESVHHRVIEILERFLRRQRQA
jgi:dTMP kinase